MATSCVHVARFAPTLRKMALAGIAAVAVAAAMTDTAKAAVVYTSPVGASLSVAGIAGVDQLTFVSGSVAFAVVVTDPEYSTYFPNQSPATVLAGTEAVLALPAVNQPVSLSAVSDANIGSSTVNVTGGSSFDYVSIHQAQGEIILKLSSPVTSFTFDSLNNGRPTTLSNYRTFSSGDVPPPIPPVPEPATIALLGAGLLGLGFARRKRG